MSSIQNNNLHYCIRLVCFSGILLFFLVGISLSAQKSFRASCKNSRINEREAHIMDDSTICFNYYKIFLLNKEFKYVFSKLNLNSKLLHYKTLDILVDTNIYYPHYNTGVFYYYAVTDKFNHHYIITWYNLKLTNIGTNVIIGLDDSFHVQWAYKLKGTFNQYLDIFNRVCTLDSSLYVSTDIFNPANGYFDYSLLYKFKPNGQLETIKKNNVIGFRAVIQPIDTTILINETIRCTKDLVPINSIDRAPIFSNNYGFADYKLSLYYKFKGKQFMTLGNPTNNLYPLYPTFFNTDLSKYYVISNPLFNQGTVAISTFNLDKNNRIHLYISAPVNQGFPRIRHVVLDSDWKTILEDRLYSLSKFSNQASWNFYLDRFDYSKHDLSSSHILNDSTVLLGIQNFSDLDTISYQNYTTYIEKYEYLYIKNNDFSFLPYTQNVCKDTFRVDTFDVTPIPNPVFIDTMFSLDTFGSLSTLVSPWILDTSYAPDYAQIGLLRAKFTLSKDTFCNTPVDLRSDSNLLYGTSRWIIAYLDAQKSDTLNVRDSLGYHFKHTGRVSISHTHRLNGCVDVDSALVFYSLPNIPKNYLDTLVCSPLNKSIGVKNPSFWSYKWNTGDSIPSLLVKDTGTYIVEKKGACGIFIDTFRLRWKTPPYTQAVFSLDSSIFCGANFPYVLTSTIQDPTYTYTWTPPISTGYTANLSNFGKYKLVLTDNCHTYQDSFYLIAKSITTPPNIPNTINLCKTPYTIAKPNGLQLEELINSTWTPQNSITLSQNETKYFRWIDSCGAVTTDTIKDIHKLNLSPLPKSIQLCEVVDSFIINTDPTILQYEKSQNQWLLNPKIKINKGLNEIKREDSCGYSQIDSVIGILNIPLFNFLVPDTITRCESEFPFSLNLPTNYDFYIWKIGNPTLIDSIYQEGRYVVKLSDRCFYYYDSLQIVTIKSNYENALKDSLKMLCAKIKEIEIKTDLVYPVYIWNQIITKLNYYIADTSDQKVSLQIPRQCDTLRDRVLLTWLSPKLPYPEISIDSSFCDKSEKAVKVTLLNPLDYTKYQWNQVENTPEIYSNSLEPIYFHAHNICEDTIFNLNPIFCPATPIGLPNSFSPNGDGINDTWQLNGNTVPINLQKLQVFDRWGEKVYETNRSDFKWDGTYRGTKLPQGVYRYYAEYELRLTHQIQELQGVVNVMR